jgi:hypothetical protein
MSGEVLLYPLFVSIESRIEDRIKVGMRGGGRRSLGHSGEGEDNERCGVRCCRGKWNGASDNRAVAPPARATVTSA